MPPALSYNPPRIVETHCIEGKLPVTLDDLAREDARRDADGSLGGRGFRVRGKTPRGARGGRPRSGGAQRPRLSAPGDDGRRYGGSAGAAG